MTTIDGTLLFAINSLPQIYMAWRECPDNSTKVKVSRGTKAAEYYAKKLFIKK
ncbi:hypothetical protein Tcan_16594 [Toxocara canis]|uniref:Uncharacterized protein n=1 Tax=Toxocara canis TaxID=6265 RepID=A0A0B2V5F2_TOXCA|nr:hypothetical protein Tcan_16594 [Toxocara canis]